MKRCLLVFAVTLGLGSAAAAAALTMVPSQAVYSVGDTVTITVTGDGQGGSASSVYALFSYDPSILFASPPSGPPIIIPFASPGGVLECGGGTCEAFDQLPSFPPLPPSSTLYVNTISFLAVAPGTTNLEWIELD